MTDDVFEYARKRYHTDAEFHARVEVAVQIVLERHVGADREAVTMAAAVGLAMEWVDPQTGRIFDE